LKIRETFHQSKKQEKHTIFKLFILTFTLNFIFYSIKFTHGMPVKVTTKTDATRKTKVYP